MHIQVCEQDFDVGTEYQALVDASSNAGAQTLFVGRVREFSSDDQVESLVLSHYPGMTEKVIREICEEAEARWQLQAIRVLHRVGELKAGDQIVLVGVSSEHRADAFAGAEYIMDALKTRATFWKKEKRGDGEHWLEMKQADKARAARWKQENA